MRIVSIDVLILAYETPYTNELKQLVEQMGLRVSVTKKALTNIPAYITDKEPKLILLDVAFVREKKFIIEQITYECNRPIIVLSSQSVHDTADTVYAITNGAQDFILCDQLIKVPYKKKVTKKIQNVLHITSSKSKRRKARIAHHERLKANEKRRTLKDKPLKHDKKLKEIKPEFNYIVAIGTSTGGPKALQAVLNKLPRNFPAPIVIVQHMPSGFTKSLAKRLDHVCNIHVKEAVDGERLRSATAYIAPGNYHMAINDQLEISVYKAKERDGHRPSVNILFESIAELTNLQKLILILTGMGKDGAKGIRKIKEHDEDAVILVESIETAIIHGMPRAVLETGYVSEELRLETIGDTIIQYIMKRGN